MNDWTPTQIKELVGREIAAERRFRDALRKADAKEFREYKATTERALKLLATQRANRIAVALATLSLVVATFTAVVFYLSQLKP